jgi:hypothetical protein
MLSRTDLLRGSVNFPGRWVMRWLGVAVAFATLSAAAVPSGQAGSAYAATTPSSCHSYAYDHLGLTTLRVSSQTNGRRIEPPHCRDSIRLEASFGVAAEAGSAVRTVAALTREQDAALRAVMRNPNSLEHIFGQGGKHNLGDLVKELGGEAILRIPRSQAEGVFKLTTSIGSHSVTVTGRMMNGVPRVSNMWVP